MDNCELNPLLLRSFKCGTGNRLAQIRQETGVIAYNFREYLVPFGYHLRSVVYCVGRAHPNPGGFAVVSFFTSLT